MRPRYVGATKNYIENSKDRKTGTRREYDGTTTPGRTRNPDNPLNGIQNPIPRNPNNHHKGI